MKSIPTVIENLEDGPQGLDIVINSPGGAVSAALAIYDTMNFVECDVRTICTGLAASGGALLLAAGTQGKRVAMPNAKIMIHQPLGGAQGAAAGYRMGRDGQQIFQP